VKASIPHFVQTIDEIERNSWWATTIGPKLRPITFTYAISNGQESITDVPKEPFESLLLGVRRLTMNGSSEQLHNVQKALKRSATHDLDRRLLDVWHKYWRLAFIKEPFECVQGARREVMTRFRVYDCFVNGRYFHSNVPDYNVILYGSETSGPLARPFLFFQNMFYSIVVDLCFCAIGLQRFFRNGNTFTNMPFNDGISTVFDFIFQRNKADQLDTQYKIFNDWIESRGGCKKCHWG